MRWSSNRYTQPLLCRPLASSSLPYRPAPGQSLWSGRQHGPVAPGIHARPPSYSAPSATAVEQLVVLPISRPFFLVPFFFVGRSKRRS